ncbi:hypothetical protein ACFE04_007739 [Oxalis oulophora]
MGTGWRRAFCTTVPRDQDSTTTTTTTTIPCNNNNKTSTPRTFSKLSFFSSNSTPNTPRLRCKTNNSKPVQSQSNTPKTGTKTPKSSLGSNPTSPKSPLKFSLLSNSFKFRSSCGICLNSVKAGQGTAIYTAECAHAFHFPCITEHVRRYGTLVCPVCNTVWNDVPLLAVHKNLHHQQLQQQLNDKTVKTEQTVKIIDSSRSYFDDEPLVATAEIKPIPENVENEDEIEEFQGFFVDPMIKVKTDDVCNSYPDSRLVQVKLLPESVVISSNRGYDTFAVALRVKAPPQSHLTSSRAPIDLVALLDVSGSMNGAKLEMLKRAVRLVISSLGSADRLSIVAFAASPKRLLPLKRMTVQGQRAAQRIVDRLVCGQGSCIVSEALKKATKILDDRIEMNPVASIVLLSDGQDEMVNTNSNHNQRRGSSHASSTRFAHVEIPINSYGFGQSYGYSHEPVQDALAKAVGGTLSFVVQDLRIQLGFASGSAPAEISAVYSCNGRPTVLNSGSLRLSNLYADEERELLLELRAPASALAAGSHLGLSVRCLYKDPTSQAVVYGGDQTLLVPRPAIVSSRDPKMERLRNLFITARALAESGRLIDQNEFTTAYHLLASSRALLIQCGSSTCEDYVKALEAELAELHWKRNQVMEIQRRRGRDHRSNEVVMTDENGEPLTPTSAWRVAEKLAKVAMMKKMNSDLHGFENARF